VPFHVSEDVRHCHENKGRSIRSSGQKVVGARLGATLHEHAVAAAAAGGAW
jgi:hypothetical protein